MERRPIRPEPPSKGDENQDRTTTELSVFNFLIPLVFACCFALFLAVAAANGYWILSFVLLVATGVTLWIIWRKVKESGASPSDLDIYFGGGEDL